MAWVVTAVVGSAVVGGALAADASKSAAKTAAGAQTAASDASIAESRYQFDEMQKILQPYTEAGDTALTEQMNLLGLGGTEAQQAAITGIEQSPQFEALIGQGEEAILQNAAATGGLRGGNTQAALAQYRPQILSQLIESQYSKLGGLTQLGQASAAGVGSAGLQTGSNISNALIQSGQAQAGSALAARQATSQAIGDVTSSIGTLGTLKLMGKF